VFSENYLLSDFHLCDEYNYWEIRRGALPQQDVTDDEVIAKYDDISFNNLDSTQVQIVTDAVSQGGFAVQCLPSFCPIYAVALRDYNVTIIDSRSGLIDFFGEIDTEAELSVLLNYDQSYQLRTQPELYEQTADGFLVVLKWDTLCQLRGKDLVKVYKDGEIKKIREISRESYNFCV
jgi:hypothetical protein